MLKLNTNETPTGVINGTNKIYKTANFIGTVQNITVDGTDILDAYSLKTDTVTLTVAPVTSITISYFSREERDILGNGELTMGDLIDGVYSEIGRLGVSRVYPKAKIRAEMNDTLGLLLDDVPERSNIQHYSFKGINGLTVVNEENNLLTVSNTYDLDIAGSLLIGKGIYYNYFSYDGTTFEVNGDLSEQFDKIIIGHRVPTGVERVSEVYVDGTKLEYIDSRDFYMDTQENFTIIKDYQGNSYLYLPYAKKEYTCVVKYLPDFAEVDLDNGIINLEKRYKRLPIYDVSYRLLASREDDRASYYKGEKNELLKKYKAFKANATIKTKSKIGLADTYSRPSLSRGEFLPDGVYDEYR